MARIGVYTDYTYRRADGVIYAERAFSLFLAALAESGGQITVLGKIDRAPGVLRYRLPDSIAFVELPYYPSMTHFVAATVAMVRSLTAFWRALDGLDGVWLLGPHPLALTFAAIALARRRSVVLGVRQDFPTYVRSRHPGRRWLVRTGDALDLLWRALARWVPTIVVGPALGDRYARGRTLEIAVSLVPERAIAPAQALTARRYDDPELRVLSVGRLEEEKNPLLLADVAAGLRRRDARWRLLVCGEGPLEAALRERARQLGVEEAIVLLGYLAHDRLADLYRSSHVLLHVSWTEGLPQVLFEAAAARLPIVATAVGGIEAAFGGAALLIGPGDAGAAVAGVERIASDSRLREELAERAAHVVGERTLEAEAARVLGFLDGDG